MLFLRMTKVDAGRHIVVARLDETPDNSGMVLDYDSSKPAFQTWSDAMRKATDGASLGNVREMHGLKAAGKVTRIEFLDMQKAIEFEIEVVDDDTMEKIERGVLTGISQGGRFGRKWMDGPHQRYTAKQVSELSLVDFPCNTAATFSMIKADGAEVEVTIAPEAGADLRYLSARLSDAEDISTYRQILLATPAEMLKAVFADGGPDTMQKRDYDAAEREALAAKGEAMPGGEFPIATKADVKDAVDCYGQASDKPAAKDWIVKRAKDLDATDLLPTDWAGSTKQDDMKKGMDQVAQFSSLLQSLAWLVSDATWEAASERDGSKIPANLAAWVKQGAMILSDMVTEETAEIAKSLQAQVDAIPVDAAIAADMEKVTTGEDMLKAGARNSKADATHIQAIHDAAQSLGATCSGPEQFLPSMAKMNGELLTALDDMARLRAENDTMQKRIQQLEKTPHSGGPALRAGGNLVIDKGADREDATTLKTRADAAMAEISAMPDGLDKTVALTKHAMTYGSN